MGYTHYFHHEKRFSDAQWSQIIEAFSSLVDHAHEIGIKLSCDNETPMAAHQIVERAWHVDPGADDPAIVINGVGEQAHETFMISKLADYDGSNFTKTARKPYDTVATAAMIWIESHFPGHLNVSSDGSRSDWKEGMAFAQKVFPLDARLDYPPGIRK